ncbi:MULTISPECIES: DUF5908 family protein [Flavobacterium]|jgi:hypothetical protein|uniref:DUF5908 family protein n=1 Tax=Flavobacterium lipolyticum TaxID=2893754 RepID=A0ABS8M3D1_9FLAO|nr:MULTISPECIES: DUF5908 family protein [Flavobacterium]MCC9018711.1 DUF5908 family protein [Flavobacterium sp. F-126]MDL2144845.1 DUF5908 family protein [Flavobacterium tructae]URC14628.1 DUF5908 family protein [Flavobacterium sp. B183]
MPIEIKELHIKINVSEGSKPAASPNSPKSKGEEPVAECVDQVMKIIERKKER